MRISSMGHAVFAAAMIGLGILGLVKGDFASVWQPVPDTFPARMALAYLCAAVSLIAGISLLRQRTALFASRVLVVYLLLWLFLLKAPDVLRAPSVEFFWLGCGEIAVILAGAWVLFSWFTSSDKGARNARILFGLALVPLGLAHMIYVNETAAMVPGWLPLHQALAYATGCTYLAAALAVLIKVRASLAAALCAVQMGGFTLLIWVPNVAADPGNDFQWAGTLISLALTAGAWVVADSYRDIKAPRS